MTPSNRAGLTGFLLSAFLIVGLTGLFSIYALPIPFERALNKLTLLDEARVAADAGQSLPELRSKLGELAEPVLNGPGTAQERITRARASVMQEMTAEVSEISLRLRWLVVIASLSAAGFGVALLGMSSRRDKPQ